MTKLPSRPRIKVGTLGFLAAIWLWALLLPDLASAHASAGTTTTGKSGWKNRSAETAVETARGLSLPDQPPTINGPSEISAEAGEDRTHTLKFSASVGSANAGLGLVWQLYAMPSHGTAELTASGLNASLAYRPDPDYTGPDTLSVQVANPAGAADTVVVNFNVVPVNDVPVSHDFASEGYEDAYLAFSFDQFAEYFADPEAAPLASIRISPLPNHGTLYTGIKRVIDGQEILPGLVDLLTYLPDNDWHGSDSFGWTGSDGSDYALVYGTVSLTILPANDNPLITDHLEDPVIVDEDGSPQAFNLILHAADLDLENAFSWSIASQPEHGLASITPAGVEVPVQYMPDPNYSGPDQFTVQVEDQNGGKDTLDVMVDVRPVDDPPRVADSQQETVEETVLKLSSRDFLDAFTPAPGGSPMKSARINALPSNGQLLLAGQPVSSGTDILLDMLDDLDYQPAPNFTGADTFAWTACDSSSCSIAPATVHVQVTNVNDAPLLPSGNQVTAVMDEDGSPRDFALDVEALDPDPGDTITWSLLTPPLVGTASVSGTFGKPEVAYKPPANFSGRDEFSLSVADSFGEASELHVEVLVKPSNDLPVLSAVTRSIPEDTTAAFTPDEFTAAFTDPDGDLPVKIRIESLPTHGSLSIAGLALRTAKELAMGDVSSLEYLPNPEFSGMDYFRWTAFDGSGWAAPGSLVSISVSPVEDAPTIKEGSQALIDLREESGPGKPMLTLHGSDADRDVLTWVLLESPAFGSLSASGEGYDLFLDYTPTAGYAGADSFTIQLSDEHTDPAVVKVQVSGQADNHSPSATGSAITMQQASDYTFRPGDFGYQDPENDPLQSIQVSNLPESGYLYLDLDGNQAASDSERISAGQTITAVDLTAIRYHYDPAAPLANPVTFTFTVSDGNLSSSAPAVIQINPLGGQPKIYLPLIIK